MLCFYLSSSVEHAKMSESFEISLHVQPLRPFRRLFRVATETPRLAARLLFVCFGSKSQAPTFLVMLSFKPLTSSPTNW